MNARRFLTLAAPIGLIAFAECASNPPSPMDYGVRHTGAASRAVLLDTAERALLAVGYRIETRDNAAGRITARTEPEAPLDEGLRREVGVSSRNRIRRVAEIRMDDSRAQADVYCKVMIQEQATQGYRMLAYDRGGTDRPGDLTAIDRDAGSTAEQNVVWRNIRRDKAAERELLTAILGNDSSPSQ